MTSRVCDTRRRIKTIHSFINSSDFFLTTLPKWPTNLLTITCDTSLDLTIYWNLNFKKYIVKLYEHEKANAISEFIWVMVNHAGASDHFLNWSAKASPQIAPEKDFVLRLKVDALYAMTSRRLYYQIHQIAENFGRLWKAFKKYKSVIWEW